MTLMCLQVALNRAPLENCRDKTEASAQVLLQIDIYDDDYDYLVYNDDYDNDDDYDDNAVQNLWQPFLCRKFGQRRTFDKIGKFHFMTIILADYLHDCFVDNDDNDNNDYFDNRGKNHL